jgi:hypothetical protein
MPRSPPGVPGGGITGIRPPPLGGTVRPGSIPAGGQMTPFDSARRSLKGRFPVVSFAGGRGLSGPAAQSFLIEGDAPGEAGRSCACAIDVERTKAAATTAAGHQFRMSMFLGVVPKQRGT